MLLAALHAARGNCGYALYQFPIFWRSDLLQHRSEYWKPRDDTVLGRLEPIGEADALNQQRIVDGLGE